MPPKVTTGMDGSMPSMPDSSIADAGSSPDVVTVVDAGIDTGVDSGSNYCTQQSDCVATSSVHPEVACDVDRNQCVQLTTDECANIAPQNILQNLGGLNPIFIGAFATIPSNGPLNHPSYLNYNLALTEFANAHGIPAGGGQANRIPVAVVCDDTADTTTVMNHLVNDVHVPAVIAALSSSSLQGVFQVTDLQNDSAVFFMNPFGSDTSLTPPVLQTGLLLWSMLGSPSDTASAYAAFFPYVERYVRNSLIGTPDGGASRPLRVAAFTATSSQDLLDLQSSVRPLLTWNDGETYQNNPNYLDVTIPYSTLDGYALTPTIAQSLTGVVNQLAAFQPDIVISFASEEFILLMQTLEAQSVTTTSPDGGMVQNPIPHPFYLLGPYNSDSTTIFNWIGTNQGNASEARRTRLAGINFASTASQVLQDYIIDFNSSYPGDSQFQGAENYYDATYFTVYALAGAGHVPEVAGSQLITPMERLVNPPGIGDARNVGPTDIPNVLADLLKPGNSAISLTGTDGPPNFSTNTGARVSQGDVYCFDKTALTSASPNAPYYGFDELRLLPDGGVAPPLPDGGPLTGIDGGAPTLYGTFDCYNGMFP
jgi:hypothetical protein